MAGRIAFGEISEVVQRTITGHSLQPGKELDDLLRADQKARQAASAIIAEKD
jgi:1-deoxy-D-xylulose 5-phosphate reductoisomerase